MDGRDVDPASQPREVTYADWRQRVEAELGEPLAAGLPDRRIEGTRIAALYTGDEAAPRPLPGRPNEPGWRICPDVGTSLALGSTVSLEGLPVDGFWVELQGSQSGGLIRWLERAAPADRWLGVRWSGESPPWSRVRRALETRGEELRTFRGCLGARAGHSASTDAGLGDVASWCAERAPQLRAAAVDSGQWYEAGADPGLEIGMTLAHCLTTLRVLTEAGLELGRAAGQIQLAVALGRDVYLQIAKVRALRLSWSMLLAAAGLGDPPGPEIHGRTSRRTKTALAPLNNLLRETVETLGGAIGGCTSLSNRPYDAVRGRESRLGRRLTVTTQLVLRHETGLDRVVDPAAGSWFLESLTEQIAQQAWSCLQEVESRGGAGSTPAGEWLAGRLEACRQRRRAGVRNGELGIAGVTAFASPEETLPEITSPHPDDLAHRDAAEVESLRRRFQAQRARSELRALRVEVGEPRAVAGASGLARQVLASVGVPSDAVGWTSLEDLDRELPKYRVLVLVASTGLERSAAEAIGSALVVTGRPVLGCGGPADLPGLVGTIERGGDRFGVCERVLERLEASP